MKKKILTDREQEVFELLIKNKSTFEIAKKWTMPIRNVRNHISNAIQKLGVCGRSQAIIELIKLGELHIN